MKPLIGMIVVLVSLPTAAAAQDRDYSRGHGYIYAAPGARAGTGERGSATIQVGGGGEGFFSRHFGVGADLAYVKARVGDAFGIFSPNFVARFRAKDDANKLEPFATVGYAGFFGSGSESGFNFGGGMNYWFRDRLGLRVELRDSVVPYSDAGDLHFVAFRIGLTFR